MKKRKSFKLFVIFFIFSAGFFLINFEKIKNTYLDFYSVNVLFAHSKVHRGQPLKKESIGTKRISKEDYDPSYIKAHDLTEEQYPEYVIKNKKEEGGFITRKDILHRQDGFIGKILKEDHRAINLNVDRDQLSNDLHGGWRVDITATDVQRKKTDIILCSVKVLDVGIRKKNKHKPHQKDAYIILEVKQDDAMNLLTSYETAVLNFLGISRYQADKDDRCVKKDFKTKVIRGLND